MTSWAFVAIVAIVVWGIVQMGRNRSGNDRDLRDWQDERSARDLHDAEAQREIEELRERIRVLERIATDGNTPDARETRRIAAEIEALRNETGPDKEQG
ncbi:hypothetical protein E3U23_00910 [Erythrobacter litoralis]|uniref:hypothetical protein n=1 Tax=Erythrobacter litoralis TaxID=39960 RepID=UPI002435F92C|nr:hypothetical protein [Erythrobacter litoralis]MDG6077758.1 hypothetical protein [Erythrobacter litoralis]